MPLVSAKFDKDQVKPVVRDGGLNEAVSLLIKLPAALGGGVEIISDYLLIHQFTHLPHILHNHVPYKIGVRQSLHLTVL